MPEENGLRKVFGQTCPSCGRLALTPEVSPTGELIAAHCMACGFYRDHDE